MAVITQDSVYAAAEALEARGARVSVRTIRDHLGGGSPNQITPLLASWRAKRPQVAQAPIQLDPRIGQLIAEQVQVAAGEAARRADERATEAEDTLQLCQQENTELAEQLAAATTALDDVRAQREQHKERLHVRMDSRVRSASQVEGLDAVRIYAFGREYGVFAATLNRHSGFAQVNQGYLEVVPRHMPHRQMAAADGGGDHPGKGFDTVRHDPEAPSPQMFPSVNTNEASSFNLDLRSHGTQKNNQVAHFGSDIGISDNGLAAGDGSA